jgi:hypothetical protein
MPTASFEPQQEFYNVIRNGVNAEFPDYFIATKLLDVLGNVVDPQQLSDLAVGTIQIASEIDDTQVPNVYNRSTTCLGALSVLLTRSEDVPTAPIVDALRTNAESLGAIASTLPIRLMNEGANPKTVADFVFGEPVKLLESVRASGISLEKITALFDALIMAGNIDEDDQILGAAMIEKYRVIQETSDENKDNAHEAAETKRARAAQKLREVNDLESALYASIEDHPDETYDWLLRNVPDSFTDAEKTQALSSMSIKYLRLMRDAEGGATHTQWKHAEKAKEIYLQSVVEQIAHNKTMRAQNPTMYSIPHWRNGDVLGLLFTTKQELQQFVEHNLDVLDDPTFFEAWHNSIATVRMQERQRKYNTVAMREQLRQAHLKELLFVVEHLGVPYESSQDLLDDVYDYFVANRADTITQEMQHGTAKRLDDKTGSLSHKITLISRSNADIFAQDFKDPFMAFLQQLDTSQAGEHLFETIEAKQGGTPYKYETTSFGDHALSVRVHVKDDGSSTYYLDIKGGGYSPDKHSQLLLRFATFSNKQVTYVENAPIAVDHVVELPAYFTRGSSSVIECEDDAAFDAWAKELGEPSSVKTGARATEKRWRTELPFVPYEGVANIIQSVTGVPAALSYYDYDTRSLQSLDTSANKVELVERTEHDVPESRPSYKALYLLYKGTSGVWLDSQGLTLEQLEALSAYNQLHNKPRRNS